MSAWSTAGAVRLHCRDPEGFSNSVTAVEVSEDIDPEAGELWGNYPQTYSLAGLINCALLLSRPWSAVR